MAAPVLDLRGLRVAFRTPAGPLQAVDGLDLAIAAGETVALVGESGSGKSASALAILGLLPPSARVAGEARVAGQDLRALRPAALTAIRGRDIGMVFQEPMTSLNPVMAVGEQVAEVLVAHGLAGRRAAAARAVELLGTVRLPDPAGAARAFPHQLSGGMRQRVMIAIAIACGPKLLIADEPTTALDVTVQAQILDLLRDLQAALGMALLLITHDLGVVAAMADRVAVLYAGRKVEEAPAGRFFARPGHPYSAGLLQATLRADGPALPGRLPDIPGGLPSLIGLPAEACAFAPRCPYVFARCRQERPPLYPYAPDRVAACFLHDPAAVP